MINHKNVARLGVCALIGVVTMSLAPAFDHHVTVESERGRTARHTESLDTREVTVRLTRQLSDAPCVEGRTWGWDRNGIWTKNGCRAEFLVESRYNRDRNNGDNRDRNRGRGRGYGSGTRQDYTTRVEISSGNGRRGTYRADHIRSVRLVRQLSDAPCREGSTWGFSNGTVWVSGGCRGLFEVTRY